MLSASYCLVLLFEGKQCEKGWCVMISYFTVHIWAAGFWVFIVVGHCCASIITYRILWFILVIFRLFPAFKCQPGGCKAVKHLTLRYYRPQTVRVFCLSSPLPLACVLSCTMTEVMAQRSTFGAFERPGRAIWADCIRFLKGKGCFQYWGRYLDYFRPGIYILINRKYLNNVVEQVEDILGGLKYIQVL